MTARRGRPPANPPRDTYHVPSGFDPDRVPMEDSALWQLQKQIYDEAVARGAEIIYPPGQGPIPAIPDEMPPVPEVWEADDAPPSGSSAPAVEEEPPAPVAEAPPAPAQPKPAPAPAQPVTGTRADLARILGVGKVKGALPTLVSYKASGTGTVRHVIVDVGPIELQKAWECYRAQFPDATSETFLIQVYEVLGCEVPRMYRAVSVLKLE